MKNIEKRQSWQLALSSIVLALMFAVIIISGYELFIAQSIALFSFFILSRRIKFKMYIVAVISAIVIFIMVNPAIIIWVAPSLLIPIMWLDKNKTGLNFVIVLISSLVLYTLVYLTAFSIDNELLHDASLALFSFLIIGESISSSIICYMGDSLNERYK